MPAVSSEFDNQSRDFRPLLQNALQHALPHTPDDPLKNGEVASRYSDRPDEYVISFFHVPGENQIYTTDPSQYQNLLNQAAEVLGGHDAQTDEDRRWLQEAASHELAHGQAAESLGNTDTISYYGVEFVIDENGEPLFWPYYFTAGPLKKVHHAWVAVAPKDRSETDLAIAKDLGYSESVEELSQRALAEPPVEEGWQKTVSKDEIIEALLRLTMADLEDPQS
jgi:hypothetical protein